MEEKSILNLKYYYTPLGDRGNGTFTNNTTY
jgi:hypothetical protein